MKSKRSNGKQEERLLISFRLNLSFSLFLSLLFSFLPLLFYTPFSRLLILQLSLSNSLALSLSKCFKFRYLSLDIALPFSPELSTHTISLLLGLSRLSVPSLWPVSLRLSLSLTVSLSLFLSFFKIRRRSAKNSNISSCNVLSNVCHFQSSLTKRGCTMTSTIIVITITMITIINLSIIIDPTTFLLDSSNCWLFPGHT